MIKPCVQQIIQRGWDSCSEIDVWERRTRKRVGDAGIIVDGLKGA